MPPHETNIYLDHNAAPPILPEVIEAMTPAWGLYANAASTHAHGKAAADALEKARESILASIAAAEADRLVFTSSATESNNLAIMGAALARAGRGRHLVVSAIEHPSVLEPSRQLERGGFTVTRSPVDSRGVLEVDAFRESLRDDTVLVSIMLANHEIGAIQPVKEVAEICHARGILVHTDASQAVGKMPVDFAELGVHILTLSGNKAGGPKGVGGLVIKRDEEERLFIRPLLHGGGQEGGLRSGTPATPLAIGFCRACQIATLEGPENSARLRMLRDRFEAELTDAVGVEMIINGVDATRRLPNTSSLSFRVRHGERLVRNIQEYVSVSAGSACNSPDKKPSHVLAAIGVEDALAEATIRVSLGHTTTKDEVDQAVETIAGCVRRHAMRYGPSEECRRPHSVG